MVRELELIQTYSAFNTLLLAALYSRYAMERTDSEIKIWFWSRNDRSIPSDVRNAPISIDTSSWGTPFADFPNTDCDLASHFGPNNIVINLTFCMWPPTASPVCTDLKFDRRRLGWLGLHGEWVWS
jgi:hypothetical protein